MKTRRMRILLRVVATLSLLGAAGCESLLVPQGYVTGGANSEGMGAAMAVPYNGPRARLAVVSVENKSAKGGRIGDGMAEMLVTAVVNSNRYIILERRELGGVLAEQDLATGGKVLPGTQAPTGQVVGSELLVYGAITEFEPNFQSNSGVLRNRKYGSLLLNLKQAHVALDLRVVDARTSQLLAAMSVTGRATDLSASVFAPVGGGSSRMGIGLAGYRNQPIEKAIRVCLARAVEFIVARTPAQFYHYDASGQPFVPNWPPPPIPAPGGAKPPPQSPAVPHAGPPAGAPASAAPQRVRVTLQTARVFQNPDAGSALVATVVKDTLLRLEGEKGNWYAVTLPDGRRGWVLKSFTSPAAPGPPVSRP